MIWYVLWIVMAFSDGPEQPLPTHEEIIEELEHQNNLEGS